MNSLKSKTDNNNFFHLVRDGPGNFFGCGRFGGACPQHSELSAVQQITRQSMLRRSLLRRRLLF